MTDLLKTLLPNIEAELQHQVARLDQPRTRPFYEMLAYHMGWSGEGSGPDTTGKRIRPILVLLVTAACQSEWLRALPAAAAVELVHNFSLIHDDIQDNSDKRRGRLTVWKKWGAPMGINVGDALFVISNQAITDLEKHYPSEIVLQAARILHDTCLDLTCGQFLDMSYEKRTGLTVEDYWPMVSGKTAALLAACTHIGALLGGANEEKQEAYRLFGHHLGLAFQVQDDILGIWGDEAMTGKSVASDLVEGKKSLPVLFGLSKQAQFAAHWKQTGITSAQSSQFAAILAADGAYDYAQNAARDETDKALESLKKAGPLGEAGDVLLALANQLLNRQQ